jgi:hypothetical protein
MSPATAIDRAESPKLNPVVEITFDEDEDGFKSSTALLFLEPKTRKVLPILGFSNAMSSVTLSLERIIPNKNRLCLKLATEGMTLMVKLNFIDKSRPPEVGKIVGTEVGRVEGATEEKQEGKDDGKVEGKEIG